MIKNLHTRITLWAFIAFLILTGSLSYLELRFFESKSREADLQHLSALASATANTIDLQIGHLQDVIVAVAGRLPPGSFSEPEITQQFLDSQFLLHEHFNNGLALIDQDGKVVAESPRLKGQRGKDLSSQVFFERAKNARKPFVSNPYLSDGGTTSSIVMLCPIFDENGHFQGAIGASFKLSSENFLSGLVNPKIGNKGYMYIVDGEGNYILRPQRQSLGLQASGEKNALLRELSNNEFEGADEIIDENGVATLTGFTKTRHANWIVGANLPRSELSDLFNASQPNIYISIAVGSFGFVVLVWVLLRRETAPLHTLVDHMRALHALPPGKRHIALPARNEVAVLVTAFNEMLDRLDTSGKELQESEASFRAAFEQAAIGMAIRTKHGEWIDVNQCICEMLGYSRDEMIGMDPLSITHPDDIEVTSQAFDDFWNTGTAAAVHRKRYLHKDGRTVWVQISSNRLVRSGGDKDLILGIFADITESVRAERALNDIATELEQRIHERTADLEAANKAKSHFLSTMSHELRTPLNAILGFAQLLEVDHKTPLSPTHSKYLRHILDAGNHLLALINDVLDLSRIESEVVMLSVNEVDPHEIVAESMALAQSNAQRYGIALHDETPTTEHPLVKVDILRARQVLLNLLSNAIKYNRPGGSARVSWSHRPDRMLRLLVTDTGRGIPQDKMQYLFQPFNRLGAEASGIEGTGIGLNLTKRLVELMGGNIGAESELGKGSCFWIDFPLGNNIEHRPAIEEPGETPTRLNKPESERTIVYVEDNTANMQLMESIFTQIPDVRLLSSRTAKSGLELIKSEKPDLVIFDLQLPDMNGVDAIRLMRIDPDIRHISAMALSAEAGKDSITMAIKAGFTSYMTKPIGIPEFKETIEEMLATASSDVRIHHSNQLGGPRQL